MLNPSIKACLSVYYLHGCRFKVGKERSVHSVHVDDKGPRRARNRRLNKNLSSYGGGDPYRVVRRVGDARNGREGSRAARDAGVRNTERVGERAGAAVSSKYGIAVVDCTSQASVICARRNSGEKSIRE